MPSPKTPIQKVRIQPLNTNQQHYSCWRSVCGIQPIESVIFTFVCQIPFMKKIFISTTVLLCPIVLPVFNSRTSRARNEPFSTKILSHHLIAAFSIKYRSRSSKSKVYPQTEILLYKQWAFDQKKPLLAINHHFCLHVGKKKTYRL